jgi:hypothetical protein
MKPRKQHTTTFTFESRAELLNNPNTDLLTYMGIAVPVWVTNGKVVVTANYVVFTFEGNHELEQWAQFKVRR